MNLCPGMIYNNSQRPRPVGRQRRRRGQSCPLALLPLVLLATFLQLPSLLPAQPGAQLPGLSSNLLSHYTPAAGALLGNRSEGWWFSQLLPPEGLLLGPNNFSASSPPLNLDTQRACTYSLALEAHVDIFPLPLAGQEWTMVVAFEPVSSPASSSGGGGRGGRSGGGGGAGAGSPGELLSLGRLRLQWDAAASEYQGWYAGAE